MTAKRGDTGWWTPNGRKWHFIGPDGRALCGKWAWAPGFGELEGGPDDHKDNCAACKRKRLTIHHEGRQP